MNVDLIQCGTQPSPYIPSLHHCIVMDWNPVECCSGSWSYNLDKNLPVIFPKGHSMSYSGSLESRISHKPVVQEVDRRGNQWMSTRKEAGSGRVIPPMRMRSKMRQRESDTTAIMQIQSFQPTQRFATTRVPCWPWLSVIGWAAWKDRGLSSKAEADLEGINSWRLSANCTNLQLNSKFLLEREIKVTQPHGCHIVWSGRRLINRQFKSSKGNDRVPEELKDGTPHFN